MAGHLSSEGGIGEKRVKESLFCSDESEGSEKKELVLKIILKRVKGRVRFSKF